MVDPTREPVSRPPAPARRATTFRRCNDAPPAQEAARGHPRTTRADRRRGPPPNSKFEFVAGSEGSARDGPYLPSFAGRRRAGHKRAFAAHQFFLGRLGVLAETRPGAAALRLRRFGRNGFFTVFDQPTRPVAGC